MTSKASTIAEFLASLPAERSAVLGPLVEAIGKAAPKAVGSMEYRMPTWKLGDEVLCALNAQKNYYALYIDPSVHEACADLLAGIDCGKSCIRFKRADQLPASTVVKLVKAALANRG